SYSYDAENRLVSVDNGATATYKYDHQNRRVSKAVGSSLTHYVWQGSQVIAEHDATTPLPGYGQPPYQVQSARVDYVYAGSRMVYSTQRTSSTGGWTVRYYLSDRLSTRLVLDFLGNVLGRQAHLPFGEDFAESGTQEKHHFTSYERDGESGTDYAMNRQYSQNVGRFMRVDPYGGSYDYQNPQSANRYIYGENDPVNTVDPTGLLLGIGQFGFCSHPIWGAFFCHVPLIPPDAGRKSPGDKPLACGDWVSRFVFGADDAKLAEAVFIEFSGNIEEGIAIAFVIKNRLWFLNRPNLSDTLGIGPRGATLEQVLGEPGEFPEYRSNGRLKDGYQRLLISRGIQVSDPPHVIS
ncbi:MAG: RHS repeat-associated core domain-containing protein, partial [Acidobacteriota bacterium]